MNGVLTTPGVEFALVLYRRACLDFVEERRRRPNKGESAALFELALTAAERVVDQHDALDEE